MLQIYMTSGTKKVDYSGAFHQKNNLAYFNYQLLQQVQLVKRIINQVKRKGFTEKCHPELQFDA